jgi:O-acetyl-ADP-ribose deacetylase (regulator of RNase III)
VGQVAYIPLQNNTRFIYYLITKERYFGLPTKENFRASLEDLKRLVVDHGVKALAMPRIGSGLDKLPQEWVAETIKNVFQSVDVEITMYYL